MFDVVFRGEIVSGANLDEVKAKIAALFKTNDAQLTKLFSGQRIVIKGNVDETTAAKYRIAIEKSGALCEILPVSISTPAPSIQQPTTTSGQSTPIQSAVSQDDTFSLLPVGVDLGENQPFIPVDVKVDHLSTAPVGANLDQLKIEILPFNLNINFDLAPAGSDLDEIPRLTVPLVLSEEMDAVSVAEVGSDLAEVKIVQAAIIKELNVDIAPAGSDLGALKKEAPPPPPDTSHLTTESN